MSGQFAVVARHEALHVRFSRKGDYQERTTPVVIDVPSGLFYSWTAKDAKVAELLTLEASEPFDLIKGPMLRANHQVGGRGTSL